MNQNVRNLKHELETVRNINQYIFSKVSNAGVRPIKYELVKKYYMPKMP